MCTYFSKIQRNLSRIQPGCLPSQTLPLVSRIMLGFTRYTQTNHPLISVTFSIFLANNNQFYYFSKVLYKSSRFIEKSNAFMHLVSLDRVKRQKFYIYLIYNRFTLLNFQNALFFSMYIFFSKFSKILQNLVKSVQNMAGVPSLSNSPSGLVHHSGFHSN